jgi:acetyl esterase/lipase
MRISRTYLAGIALICIALVLLIAQAQAQRSIELPRLGVRLTRDVTYATVDGTALKLDAYEPVTKDRERPVVVYIHGGGWKGGDKNGGARFLLPLVQAGYVGFSINYRLSGEAQFPAQIYDCKAAIRWVRKHAAEYGGDGTRVGVFGTSAGGHLVALLGTSNGVKALEGSEGMTGVSSDVQAVCDWFGPSDLAKPGMGDNPDGLVARLLGAKVKDAPELAAQASPVTYIDRTDPPFLIIHGMSDPLVPIAQSRELRDELAKAGVSVKLIEVPGGKHGGFERTTPNQRELMQNMLAFFDKHLRAK